MGIHLIGKFAFADVLNLVTPTLINMLMSSMDQKVVYVYLREGTVRF